LWSPLTFFLSQKSRNSSFSFFLLSPFIVYYDQESLPRAKVVNMLRPNSFFFCCKLWPPGHVVRNDHGGLAWTGQKVLHVQILVGYNGHRKVAKKMRRTKKDTFELVDK
jgi:hypothetical protein